VARLSVRLPAKARFGAGADLKRKAPLANDLGPLTRAIFCQAISTVTPCIRALHK
jgi:hypothetical protein